MIDQILQDLKEVTIQIEGALHQGKKTNTGETEPQSQEGGNKDHKHNSHMAPWLHARLAP